MNAAPFFSRRFLWQSLAIWVVVGFLMLSGQAAAEVSVRASVNRTSLFVGEPVQFSINVSGIQSTVEAPSVKAPGLTIRHVTNAQNSVNRFVTGRWVSEQTVSFIYLVSAEKAGSFTVPAIAVNVDGKQYRTEAVGLTVQPAAPAAGGGSGGQQQPQQPTAFAEIVPSKSSGYVGEAIPVEVRLYVDARIHWNPESMPEINGEGFTKQKIPEPRARQVERNGQQWDLMVFKTAITPSRAGKLTIEPVEVPIIADVPRPRAVNRGPRSLLDNFFNDDVFGDPRFVSRQQLKPKAPSVELTVKPLPAEGRPRLFSGAVGSFQLASEASPLRVKVGDPVTVKLRVSGRGNFDGMTAPQLKDTAGWRTYPAASAFREDVRADDEKHFPNYSGTKSFEMAVVPETKKTTMPVFEFSYFDPSVEKYVTLTSSASPLETEAAPAPAATPAPAVASTAKPEDRPPTEAPQINDILGQRYDVGSALESRPLYDRREFWLAQGGMGLALVAFLGLRLRRAPDAAARVTAELRREKSHAWTRLRDGNLSSTEFYETAARIAQIDTALATGKNAASIDAATVHASGLVSEDAEAVVDEIFGSRAELLYAGNGNGGAGPVNAVEREKVMNVLRKLEKGHGRS